MGKEPKNGAHLYKTGLLRRLYNWVLSWADKKYATLALFIHAFAESSFFPIPPDVLLLSLSVSKPKRAFWFAFICTLGSIVGGLFGYLIGVGFYEVIGQPIINFFGYQAQFTSIGAVFQEHAFLAIVAAALTPLPYKVFTIAAGVWNVALLPFLIASVVGRGLRFFAEATLVFFLGDRVKYFIDKYFNALTWIAIILLVAGFLLARYIF